MFQAQKHLVKHSRRWAGNQPSRYLNQKKRWKLVEHCLVIRKNWKYRSHSNLWRGDTFSHSKKWQIKRKHPQSSIVFTHLSNLALKRNAWNCFGLSPDLYRPLERLHNHLQTSGVTKHCSSLLHFWAKRDEKQTKKMRINKLWILNCWNNEGQMELGVIVKGKLTNTGTWHTEYRICYLGYCWFKAVSFCAVLSAAFWFIGRSFYT